MVIYVYIFKISTHRWSSMVVGSKGWAERRYIREVKDVQGSSDTSRILKDIQEAFFPVEYRRTNEAPTVATSEVLRFECLSRCNYSAYSRNVGGSTLRVPLEVPSQRLQSQRRRFYASSACRGAITVPTVATSEVLRFECLSRCYSTAPIFATSEVLRSEFEVPHTTRFQGHRPHRAALRHLFVRTRTKTKHPHNAKKGL